MSSRPNKNELHTLFYQMAENFIMHVKDAWLHKIDYAHVNTTWRKKKTKEK